MGYQELLKNISNEEKEILRQYLRSEKSKFIKSYLVDNTITVEFASWKIPFYSSTDIDNALCAIEQPLCAG